MFRDTLNGSFEFVWNWCFRLKSHFWQEIITLTSPIWGVVWNLPHKFHLYLIYYYILLLVLLYFGTLISVLWNSSLWLILHKLIISWDYFATIEIKKIIYGFDLSKLFWSFGIYQRRSFKKSQLNFVNSLRNQIS